MKDNEDERKLELVLVSSMSELDHPGDEKKKHWEEKAVAKSVGSGSTSSSDSKEVMVLVMVEREEKHRELS